MPTTPPLTRQLAYLHNLQRFEAIKPGLGVIHALLAELGNPHRQFSSIHIAGTNGKGSVAAMLASMLQHSSPPPTTYNLHPLIGRYTSPHLTRFNERVCINDTPVTDGELARLISNVRAAAERTRLSPTFFEFTTAAAFLHFARQCVDIAVVEVGMGGRLDATNVITPLVSIITNIGLDHTQWLGATRRAIAREKAGIIKPGVPLVTAERNPGTLAYFASICRAQRAPFYPVHQHLHARRLYHDLNSQSFTVRTLAPPARVSFSLPLLGRHQIDNALTALLALQFASGGARDKRLQKISSRDARLTRYAQRGLAAVRWPGRLQIFSRDPFILLDGAHNPNGVRALARFLDDEPLLPSPDILVLGSKNDKDITALLKHIVPRFRHVVVTEASYQPMPAAALAERIARAGKTPGVNRKTPGVEEARARNNALLITAEPNLARALALARRELRPGQMLLITGSLYLIGDALQNIKNINTRC